MKKYLGYQKSMMEMALRLQQDMIRYRDVPHKLRAAEIAYAEVITRLTEHFLKITNTGAGHDAQQNVVSMAEEVCS
jgi:hypothetical protein